MSSRPIAKKDVAPTSAFADESLAVRVLAAGLQTTDGPYAWWRATPDVDEHYVYAIVL